MEKRAWVLLLLMVLTACRLFQHKSKSELQSSTSEQQKNTYTQWLYTQSRDSLTRSWYFWTDSGLRFHPDSGLSSQGGRLLLKESSVSTRGQHQQSVTTADAVTQNKATDKKETTNTLGLVQWWLLLLLPVLYLLWRNRVFLR